MRIGQNDNYLQIDQFEPGEDHSPWRFEAAATAVGYKVVFTHELVMPETTNRVRIDFREFADHQSQFVEIPLTEDGWLRFKRDGKGYIRVGYRICCWHVRNTIEGEVEIEGEFTGSFCKEFASLLSKTS
jgi:hypothetical protein